MMECFSLSDILALKGQLGYQRLDSPMVIYTSGRHMTDQEHIGQTYSNKPGILYKQHSPRCGAAECDVPSGAILFAKRNSTAKLKKKKM